MAMPPVPHSPATADAEHAALIVALDAGDLSGADLSRAEALAAQCPGCTALLGDLALIRSAVATLPVPPRRRDYRLTEADAARLRPAGWRRLLGWLAAPGSTVRPLATGLAALGVAGLLLTAGIPGFGSGGTTSLTTSEAPLDQAAPRPASAGDSGSEAYGSGAAATAAPSAVPAAASAAPDVLAATPPAAGGTVGGAVPVATAAPAGIQAGPEAPTSAPAAGYGPAASAVPPTERNATAGEPGGGGEAGKSAPAVPQPGGGIPIPVLVSVALIVAGVGLLLGRAVAVRRLG